jgi:hypothetical protein
MTKQKSHDAVQYNTVQHYTTQSIAITFASNYALSLYRPSLKSVLNKKPSVELRTILAKVLQHGSSHSAALHIR